METVIGGKDFGKAGFPTDLVVPKILSQIKFTDKKRISTKIKELDRVLGGHLSGSIGIVPGSAVLLAGEPGVGKSTLLLQLAESTSRSLGNKKVLFVSGEESLDQIKLRANRLKIKGERLLLVSEVNLEAIEETVVSLGQKKEIGLVIIDSIQTLSSQKLTGQPGSIGQVRHSASVLVNLAKKLGIPLFVASHVTKEGSIAGPKVLEHLVDTVIYLEGERFSGARLLRAVKNRFGATDEVGIFEMTEKGMEEISNPSSLFLLEKEGNAPGSIVAVTMEGTRPILLEVQALVVNSHLAVPRRVAQGIDYQRFQVVTAVLSRHLNLPLGSYDILVNLAGGLKIEEPALDLAIALAIFSSFKNVALGKKTAVFGELGLLGEIRAVNQATLREKEAKRLGFEKLITPQQFKTLRSIATTFKL